MEINEMKEFSKRLFNLQQKENKNLGIETIRTICKYLDLENLNYAVRVFQIDGDKLHAYPNIESELENFFGCRMHLSRDCKSRLCNFLREKRKEK